jgi:hypothetical protein
MRMVTKSRSDGPHVHQAHAVQLPLTKHWTKVDVQLPGGFATTLARVVLAAPIPKGQGWVLGSPGHCEHGATSTTTFKGGKSGARRRLRISQQGGWERKTQLSTDDHANLHCARIVGDDKGEPIAGPLANRLVYSLNGMSHERAELRKAFVDFYNTRSSIVHNGSCSLDTNEREQLEWGKNTLRRARPRELEVVK